MPALGIEIKRKCPICGKVFIIKTLDSILSDSNSPNMSMDNFHWSNWVYYSG